MRVKRNRSDNGCNNLEHFSDIRNSTSKINENVNMKRRN